MAITYLTYGNGAYTSNTVPITLQNTTSFVDGQTVLVAFVFVRGSSAPTLTKPDASWTQIGSDISVGSYMKAGCYWKVWHTADGTGPFTWTTASASYGTGVIQAFNGVNYTDPVDDYNSGSASSGTTLTVTSINSGAANRAILGFGGSYYTTGRTYSSESCATAGALSESYDGGTRATAFGARLIWSGSGATGDFTATISGSNSGWIGFLLVLKEGVKVFAGVSELASFTPDAILTILDRAADLMILRALSGASELVSLTPNDVELTLEALAKIFAGTATLETLTPAAALAVTRLLAGVATLTSATSTADLMRLVKLAGMSQMDSVTPSSALRVIRAMAGTAPLASITPAAAMVITRRLSGIAAMQSVTSSPSMAVTRVLAGLSQLQSLTPSAALSVIHALAGAAAMASSTSDVDLSVIRALAGAATITSLTPAAALAVLRVLAGTSVLSSMTPDDALLSISGLIIMAGVAALSSHTPDVVLAVARKLAGTAQLSSLTPNNAVLSRLFTFAGLAALQSNVSDADIQVIRSLLGEAIMSSVTPDSVQLSGIEGEIADYIITFFRRRRCR